MNKFKKMKGKKARVALKLDMEKAYETFYLYITYIWFPFQMDSID